MAASTAAECKHLRHKVSNIDRNIWKEKCKVIMKDGLTAKFRVVRSWKLPITLFYLKHLHMISSWEPYLVLWTLARLIWNYGLGIISWEKFLKKLGKIWFVKSLFIITQQIVIRYYKSNVILYCKIYYYIDISALIL